MNYLPPAIKAPDMGYTTPNHFRAPDWFTRKQFIRK
jgi:hypothetical protein